MTHPISETEARAHIAQACITCGPLGRVGVELEWVVADPRDPCRPVPLDRIADLLAYLPNPLPGGAVLTVEPGGQLELSSKPCRSEEHTSELQSRPHLVCRLLL